MKTSINEFKSYDELIEFFNNPIIKEEIRLTKMNTEREVATEMLKKYLNLYIQMIQCNSLSFNWSKGKGCEEFQICYE